MAATLPFVHLRTESEYGFPDGMCRVEALAERAAKAGYSAVGLADQGTLHAAVDFYQAARAQGVKPVLGCTLPVRLPGEPFTTGPHVTLLAEHMEGWHHLVQLVSHAHLDASAGDQPVTTLKRMEALHHGLIALWNPGAWGDAEQKTAEQTAGVFGPEHFYMDVHLRAGTTNPGRILSAPFRGEWPLVVTAAVQFLDPADAAFHAHLRLIRGAPPDHRPFGLPFLDPEEIRSRCPGLESAMARTVDIAGRCTVEFPQTPPLQFPRFTLPETFDAGEGPPGHREFAYLQAMASEGVRARYGFYPLAEPSGVRERMLAERFRHEMDIIRRTGFVQYFLVVWDIVRVARDRGIAVGPGRGSGAGSLVAYALGITGIDPIRFRLVFERFLNPDRISPPDFDIDFDPDRRHEVIAYIQTRYGPDHVGHIITFQRFGMRQALRDAVRALNAPPEEGDRLARSIPEMPPGSAKRAGWTHPDLEQAVRESPGTAEIVALARALDGWPRNTGTHPAGIVIGGRPLAALVPMIRDRNGQPITQFDMGALAQTGLLKIDLLGLSTLGIIEETLQQIAQRGAPAPDLEQLPEHDTDTFERLSRGDTAGIFQLESEGMRNLLRRVRITRFEELVAILALYRPGPMHLLDEYVRRGTGPEYPTDHPVLDSILAETRGLMLYQEQVQQSAQALAGFSLAQGDLLRRAIAKKNPADLSAHRAAFVEGCQRLHHIPREKADRVFDAMERFAGYGFNKSHSVAYALLSYRCAWLKTHHPQAFMTAWLSNQLHDPGKMRTGFSELRAMGFDLRPPDINRSDIRFRTEGPALRFGLAGIRHVGPDTAAAVVTERQAGGPFAGLVDFCVRMQDSGINRVAVESLIKAGAFDETGLSRSRLMAGVEAALTHALDVRRDREGGQLALFEPGSIAVTDEALPGQATAPWTAADRAAAEHEVLGLCLWTHPLAPHEWFLSRCGWDAGAEAGTVSWRRIGRIVRIEDPLPGGPHVLVLETLSGTETLALPADQPANRLDALVGIGLVAVEVRRAMNTADSDEPALEAAQVIPLADPPRESIREIRFHLGSALLREDRLDALRRVLERHPGSVPAVLALAFPTGHRLFIRIGTPQGVAAEESLVREAETVLGLQSVYFELAL